MEYRLCQCLANSDGMALRKNVNETLTAMNSSASAGQDTLKITQRILKRAFSIDTSNRSQLVRQMKKALSVDHQSAGRTTKKTHDQTNSYCNRQLRMKLPISQALKTDPCFTAAETDVDFVSIADVERHYSTKAPYPCPSAECTLSSAPPGYQPVGVQILARHGSRSLNGRDYDRQLLSIWTIAKQRNMLTMLGEQLKDDIELFMHANNQAG